MPHLKSLLSVLVVLVAIAVLVHVWSPSADDGLRAFPHAFIAQAGYDPGAVIVITGPIDQPPSAPDTTRRAWQCDDPAFADRQGQPWLFPEPAVDQGSRRFLPPLHSTVGKRPSEASCHPYHTEEGAQQLAAFQARMNP